MLHSDFPRLLSHILYTYFQSATSKKEHTTLWHRISNESLFNTVIHKFVTCDWCYFISWLPVWERKLVVLHSYWHFISCDIAMDVCCLNMKTIFYYNMVFSFTHIQYVCHTCPYIYTSTIFLYIFRMNEMKLHTTTR